MYRVCLNTLPKAGTNLFIKCLELLGYKRMGVVFGGTASSITLNQGIIESQKTKIRNWKRRLTSAVFNRGRGYIVDNVNPQEKDKHLIHSLISDVSERQFLQGHFGYSDEILIMLMNADFKILVGIRDPRAILLSRYHYIKRIEKNDMHDILHSMELEDGIRTLLTGYNDGRISVPSMYAICNSIDCWLKAKPCILVLRFEDFIGEQGGGSTERQRESISQLASFLDINTGTSKINEIQEKLYGGTRTFRRGRIDSWRDEIPPEIVTEIEDELEQFISSWGYLQDGTYRK